MQDEQNKNDQISEKLLKDNNISEEFSEKNDQSREEHLNTTNENVEEQLSPKKRKGNKYSLNKS